MSYITVAYKAVTLLKLWVAVFVESQSILIFKSKLSGYHAIRLLVKWCKTFSVSHTSSSNCIYAKALEQTQGVYKNVVGIEVVSSKVLKHCICCIWDFVSIVCVWVKIRLLVDPCCVGDGNSLPEPWGSCSAGDGVRVSVCTFGCVFVRTYQQERVEKAPQCMSQQPSHQPF